VEAVTEVLVMHLTDGFPDGDAAFIAAYNGLDSAADRLPLRIVGQMVEPRRHAADADAVERKALDAHCVLLGEIHDAIQRRPIDDTRPILDPAPEAGQGGGPADDSVV
jgi:hypothetical protein